MRKQFLILGNFLGKKIVGLTRMGYEYLLQIDKFADSFDIELLIPVGYKKYVPTLTNIKVVELGNDSSGWTTRYATNYARKKRKTVINLTSPFCLNKNSVIEIADVRYMEKVHGQFFDDFNFRFKMFLRAFLGTRQAKYVATISNFSKERIHELLHVNNSRIVVIPCGWEHMNRVRENEDIFSKYTMIKKGEYFFTLGSLARHKNHRFIIKLAQQNPKMKFVIAGGVDPQIFYKDCPTENIDNVVFTGRISDEEIKTLMTYCKAFIFPSLYEGFGIPPLEAMSCGAPVIVSDIPVMREIFKDSVHYLDLNSNSIDLTNLLDETIQRPELILNEYSWNNAGEGWYELFKLIENE